MNRSVVSASFVVGAVILAVASVAVEGAVLGVPASEQSRYSGPQFICDNELAVPISAVNDDYCDCVDGTDEPGTSACDNGVFYCVQKGFHGKRVPSSLVNDGVCDCCDGADEHGSGAGCANTCLEDGADYRRQREEMMMAMREGARIKKEYIAQGAAAKTKRESEITEKKAAIEVAQRTKTEAETLAAAEEQIEEHEKLTMEGDAVATLYSSLGIDGLDADQLRSLLVAHVRSTNTSMELVNRMNEQFGDDAGAGGDGDATGDGSGDSGGDGDAQQQFAWVDGDVEYERPAAVAARSALDEASDNLSSLERDLRTLESSDEKDYGPNNEFFPLDGKCFSTNVAQYKYEVCPFGASKQDHTSLGTMQGFADGYKKMEFKDGQRCWNGPMRSMTVDVVCGSKEELSDIDEPSTCVYHSKFTTPAACDEKFADEVNFDELELDSDGVPVHT